MRSRIRRSKAVWLALFQQHIDSGLNAAEFCQLHSLDAKYFSKRKKELQAKAVVSDADNRFIKVRAAHTSGIGSATTMVLHYRNTQLHIPAGTDLNALAHLMTLLS